MSFLSILSIGIGLSMDAFAVSITKGMASKKGRIKQALKIALFFGVFQALMPLIGYSVGNRFSNYIERFDHWIAFILLTVIGGKMFLEAFSDEELECSTGYEEISYKDLTLLAIATSIDALVVGLTFAALSVHIVNAITIIGITTFIICFVGVNLGIKFCSILGKKSEIVGGIILVTIGLKIFLEHIFF